MLTENTPIPTHARGAVRAFIKGQSGFAPWLARRGIDSRDVKNADLLAYALENNLSNEVLAILNTGNLSSAYGAAHDNFPNAPTADEGLAAQAAVQPVAQAADVASILAPVEAFLSPLVKNELEKALAPVVAAANKPAVVKEVVKEVERLVVQNLSPLPVGATPYASPTDKIAVGTLFGFRGNHAKNAISRWEAHGAAPAIDPYYVVDSLNMALMATTIESGGNVWLAGPSGSGKTTMPQQFAAYTGRPCMLFSFTRQTEVADLVGGPAVMPDGSTQWEDGALIQAVKRPGMVVILDELTIAPAGVQAIFHSLAGETRSLLLPTGEKVVCALGVVFVTADNTAGFGDETGLYHGTNAANQALVNRFATMLQIDYMSKAAEAKALVQHTKCPQPAAEHLADFVARARKLPEMENVVLSLRQMKAFVNRVQEGYSAKVAAQVAFLNRLPQAERAALDTLFTLAWGQEFSNLMSGTATDIKSPDAMGPQSAPAQAFDDEVSASLVR